jgi:hypothetical protein
LQALIDEDVLAEDVTFDQSTPEQVVRLTYQKFADHLIARHLLARQLDTSSMGAVKQSFEDINKLGAYFVDPETALDNIGIIQAMMIEFPTRIRNRGELLDFLDWKRFPLRLCEAFIEGLYWRAPSSINKSTIKLIDAFLGHEELRNNTLNVLVGLAVKPQHPLRADRLDKFLKNQKLPERDLFWTEYLRNNLDRGTPTRILIWAEHSAGKAASSDFASAYVKILKWFLTSTQRGFRDRTTHALFRLGRRYPEILYEETLQSLRLNDPYVPERMLAASYGVAMALWQDASNPQFRAKVLPRLARNLYREMFADRAKYHTTHALSRDYAQRAIEIALLTNPRLLSRREREFITPPFRLGGVQHWGQGEDQDEGRYREGDSPLGMDFANYTLGRLVRNRGPYDDTAEYKLVKKHIFWRIYNLGYSLQAFSNIDRQIARESWRQESSGRGIGKTDRYGKKYSWIAFYELAGYRSDRGLLDNDERLSDADIDPSFPEAPIFPPVFQHSWITDEQSVREWLFSGYRPSVETKLVLTSIGDIQGPWVLLRGHVNRETNDKTIFAYFNGLLVSAHDASGAQEILASSHYRNIPRVEEEHYSYAGEVPWANTWRVQQYPESISLGEMKVKVVQPVRYYSWESYHSTENQLRGVPFPSRELGESLKLYTQIPSIVMAERGSSKIAMVTILWGDPYHNHESLLFIREDLLNSYLEKTAQSLVLFVWGERRGNYHAHTHDARELEGRFDIEDALHRQGFIYKPGRYEQFL